MNPIVIVTAFEPSGDAHAAPVIAELLRREPAMRVIGWGGPRMAEAGAEIVQETVADGAMGLQALSRVQFVRQERARLKAWLRDNRADLHLAVDSPAANFPLCRESRAAGLRVVHLVAPQLWAWGPWRAGRLRRTTDLVLCLLPFEEAWFRARNIPATFVGHPRIDRVPATALSAQDAARMPDGHPRLGLFPGSRAQEIRANLPLMLAVRAQLTESRAGLQCVIAAANERIAGLIQSVIESSPRAEDRTIPVIVGASDQIAAWCDLALTVSGTMSLDLTRTGTPMVGIYRTSRLAVFIAQIVLQTPFRLLPNVVAGRGIVPEFVPCANDPQPIVRSAAALLDDPAARRTQHAALAAVVNQFEGHHPDQEAADAILGLLRRT